LVPLAHAPDIEEQEIFHEDQPKVSTISFSLLPSVEKDHMFLYAAPPRNLDRLQYLSDLLKITST
jgi:hypothetical protein